MADLIVRTTMWHTYTEQSPLQVSLCVMDDAWEPLTEITRQCGPFHPLEERLLELHDEARRWLRRTGWQPELFA